MYEVTTIGDLVPRTTRIGDLDLSPEAISVNDTFAGATNRTQIAAFMGAMAYEKLVKGVAVGFVGGILVAGALGYLMGLRPTVRF
jgi:hypothetical protein